MYLPVYPCDGFFLGTCAGFFLFSGLETWKASFSFPLSSRFPFPRSTDVPSYAALMISLGFLRTPPRFYPHFSVPDKIGPFSAALFPLLFLTRVRDPRPGLAKFLYSGLAPKDPVATVFPGKLPILYRFFPLHE